MPNANATKTAKRFTVDSLTDKELERFFAKIVADPATGCWNWTGCTAGIGYGSIRFRNREMVYTHRLMYAWVFGPLPKGRGKRIPTVDHKCNNTRCCNPFHLQVLSHRDNVLKSNSISAVYARRTHCNNGHLLDGRNARCRYCKTCNRASAIASYSRRKRRPRQIRMLTFAGTTQSVPAWAKQIGVSYNTLHARLNRGMPVERALTIPPPQNRVPRPSAS